MNLLNIVEIDAHYGEFQALSGVNLNVEEGKLTALVGSNGAGKSTLLKCICGLLSPSTGQILFRGAPIEKVSPREIVRKGIALCPEGRRVFPGLTVLENLRMGAYTTPGQVWRSRLSEVLTLFPRLQERRHQEASSLSGGEQQMLAIARALMAKPRLILFDEPSLGLAPIIIDTVIAVIKQILEQGVAVLLVEQNVSVALSLAQYAYVLEGGCIVKEGTGSALSKDPTVQAAYLGI